MSQPSPTPHSPAADYSDDVRQAVDGFHNAWRRRALGGPPPDPEVWAERLVGAERVQFAREVASLIAKPSGQETADQPTAGDPARLPAPLGISGYEVLGELGAGGTGVVYKARQVEPDRVVALKVVTGVGRGPGPVARFKAESRAVGRLDHPNIVRVYDVGEHDGRPYYATEIVDGGSLEAKLDRQPMEPRPAAELTRTLARAVHHAHMYGVIHRELTPANVLLTSDGTPKIDFGLVRLANDAGGGRTRTGAAPGAPSYMAPELAEGHAREVTPLADVYALGATLYELLTGRPPFQGPSAAAVLTQVRSHEPVRPADLQPDVPRDLEAVCLKCLRKDPAERYATADELADDLDRFLDGQPTLARPIGPAETFARWCRRNRKLAAWGFTVAGLTLALTAALAASAVVLGGKTDRLAAQTADLERANADLTSANAAVRDERDAARRLSELNAEQVRYLMRKLAADLKYLGLARQKQELVRHILDQVARFERLSTEGSGVVDRTKVSGWVQLGELFDELSRNDPDGRAAHLDRAEKYFTRAAELARRGVDRDGGSDVARGNLALALTRRGEIALARRAVPEAEALFDEGHRLRREITDDPKSQPGTPDHVCLADRLAALAESHNRLARLARAKNDLKTARQHDADCLGLREQAWKTVAADPKSTGELGGTQPFVLALADSYVHEAIEVGFAPRWDLAAADRYFTEALKLSERAVADSTEDVDMQRRLANVLYRVGVNKLIAGQAAPARDQFERAAATVQLVLGQGDEYFNPTNRQLQGKVLYGLGVALQKLGERGLATATFQQCVDNRQRLYDEEESPQHAWYLMVALARAGHYVRAVKELRAEQGRQDEPERKPQAQNFWFNAACTYSLAAEAVGGWKPDDQLTAAERKQRTDYTAAGLDAVRKLIEAKSRRVRELATDPDLEYFQALPAFKELASKG